MVLHVGNKPLNFPSGWTDAWFDVQVHAVPQSNFDDKKIHPTQKPVKLYQWILINYANPNMKIIDTHVGSASSIIAFLDFGCEWIGFEIDPDYHRDGSERIEIHKQRPKSFFTAGELLKSTKKINKQKGFFDK